MADAAAPPAEIGLKRPRRRAETRSGGGARGARLQSRSAISPPLGPAAAPRRAALVPGSFPQRSGHLPSCREFYFSPGSFTLVEGARLSCRVFYPRAGSLARAQGKCPERWGACPGAFSTVCRPLERTLVGLTPPTE